MDNNLFGEGMQNLFGDAEKMRKQMEGVQKTLKDLRVVGAAGGNAVRVTANGERRILRVDLGETSLNDRPLLEDLIAAATNDAIQKAEAAATQKIQSSLAGALANRE